MAEDASLLDWLEVITKAGESIADYQHKKAVSKQAAQEKRFLQQQNLEFQNTVFRVEFGGGVLPQASVVDGIRLKMHDAGNISGTTKLYGVKQL